MRSMHTVSAMAAGLTAVAARSLRTSMCSCGTVTRGKPWGMARAETAAAPRAARRRKVLETIVRIGWRKVRGGGASRGRRQTASRELRLEIR